MKRILFRNGTLLDPTAGLDGVGDLLIGGEKILATGEVEAGPEDRVVDVEGCLVLPGFVDMHVHLREPGYEDKETIETGCRAAVAGGFTAVACMPNTDPVNDSAAVTRFMTSRAADVGLARVYPIGAITRESAGEQLAEMGAMLEAGAVAFSDDGRPVQNNQIMRRALEYAGQFGVPLLDHCEDLQLSAQGCINEGPVSTRLGLPGMSGAAEELDILRDIVLSRLTGTAVHICHISTAESLEWVRYARSHGVAVTCEVTPHHLLLSDEDIPGYDTRFKMSPPLRRPEDVAALVEGLVDGTIDAIATDHAPHTVVDKEGSFESAANGIVGLETAVPLIWDRLVRPGTLSVARAVELLSQAPARILGVTIPGLEAGAPADVTIVDPGASRTVDSGRFESKGRNTPFDGWKLTGWPRLTVVGGRIVWGE